MKISDYLENIDRYATGEVAELCITSFFKCFEANNIDLKSLPKFNSSVALRRGLPFTYINPEVYEIELIKRICNYFSRNHKFNEDDFAEIFAVALLAVLKAENIDTVMHTSEKNYDFDITWFGQTVEVEVTRPGEKDAWSERVSQSSELIDYINKLKFDFNLHIYLNGLFSGDEKIQLYNVISTLKNNQLIEEHGKWAVFSETPHGDPKILFKYEKDKHLPKWWPENVINGFSLSGMVAGPDQTDPIPRIHIRFSCPFKGYINRAKKKATNFQGSRSKPFLLVLDVNALGDPFREFKRNLAYYFKEWKHITAVLIFIDHYDIKEIGWEFQLFINQYATRKFDAKTLELFSEYTERKRAVKYYA